MVYKRPIRVIGFFCILIVLIYALDSVRLKILRTKKMVR